MGKITVIEGGYGTPKQYIVKLLSDQLGKCTIVDALDGLVLRDSDNDVTRASGVFSHWCRVYTDKIAPSSERAPVIVVNGPMTLKHLCGGVEFPVMDNLLIKGSPDYWLPMKTILLETCNKMDETNNRYQHMELFARSMGGAITGNAALVVGDRTKNLELKSQLEKLIR
jgi:hypothetical protein